MNGLDLEIANAAFSSGFDTFNHAALFDLIWSVKRISKRNPQPGRKRPPAHPIYPDRYRPSGIGDNSKRKRKLPGDNKLSPFHPVVPLSRRPSRKHKKSSRSYKVSAHFNTTNGTQINPICLDSEDETESAEILAKKRKLNNDRPGQWKMTIDSVKWMENHVVNSTTRPLDGDAQPRSSACINVQQISVVEREVTTENRQIERHLSDHGNAAVVTDLNIVQKKLQQIQTFMVNHQKTLEDCRLAMQAHFNLNVSRYDSDHAMMMLTALAKNINDAASKTGEGSAELKNIVEWIDSDGVA